MVDQLLGKAQDVGGLCGQILLGQVSRLRQIVLLAAKQLPEGGFFFIGLAVVRLFLSQEGVHQVDPVGSGGVLFHFVGNFLYRSLFDRLLSGGFLQNGLFGGGIFDRFLHDRFLERRFGNGFLHRGLFFDDFDRSLLHDGFFCGFLGRGLLHNFGLRHGSFLLDGGFLGHFGCFFDRGFLCGSFHGLRLLGGGDGDILRTIALHVADQGMTKLSRGLPAVRRIVGAGFGDDGAHFLVRTHRGDHGLTGRQLLQPYRAADLVGEGQLTQIVNLVQNQTQGVGVHGSIQTGVGILHLGGSIVASVTVGQGSVLQGIQGYKAQIADAVLLIAEEIDVLGLQVGIQPASLPGDSHGGAQVDAQIQGAQMGHGVAVHVPLQGHAVAAEHKDLIAHALLHSLDLGTVTGHEATLFGKRIQSLDLPLDTMGQLLVVGADSLGIPENAGQKQRLHLDLRGRQRDLLNDISLFRIIPHGRIAGNTAVVGNGLTQGETIQHGGNNTGF